MKKYALELPLLAFFFLFLLVVNMAKANEQTWSKKMKEFSEVLPELLADISSQRRYHNPKYAKRIKKNAEKLKDLAHKIAEHKRKKLPAGPNDRDPSLMFISEIFEEETDRAYSALNEGHRGYARAILMATTNYCIACHTRDHGGPKFDRIKVNDSGLTDYEKADLYAATRQFDRALRMYQKILRSESEAKKRPLEWEHAAKKALAIAVRVKRDQKLSLKLAQQIANTKSAALFFRTEALGWAESLRAWKREKKRKTRTIKQRFTEARRLMAKAHDIQVYPADAVGDMYYLRASAVVHDLLRLNLSTQQMAEAFYMSGIAYEALRTFGMYSLPEIYYEACIHRMPKTKMAEKCFKRYQKNVFLGYSGSGGFALPGKVQRKLNKLEAKSLPKKSKKK